MAKILTYPIAFLLAIFTFTALSAKPITQDDVDAQLAKFDTEYANCLISENLSALGTYLSDSTRLMPEYQLTVIGGKNTLHYYKSFLARFKVLTYQRKQIETIDLGQMVSSLREFDMILQERATQKQHTIKGKSMEIWRKTNRGKLMLETQCWNYGYQVAIADQLRFTDVPSVNVALAAHLPINSNITFELAALNSLQERVITSHDPGLWTLFFTNDAKYIYSGSPIYSGKENIGKFLVEHTKYIPIFEQLNIRNDRICNLGGYIIEYASHIAIVRNGSFSGVFTGKNLNIWRREKDGSLKIFREIAMYD